MEVLQELYVFIRSLWVVWLTAVFVGIVAWAYWPSRRQAMEEHAHIPFKSERVGS